MSKREPDYWLSKRDKREIKAKVKAGIIRGDYMFQTSTEMRKLRRELRKRLRNGTFNKLGVDILKPGRFIGRMWQSNGSYKRAYSFARSEAEFYDRARYEDY